MRIFKIKTPASLMSFLHYDYSDNFPFSGHLESMSNKYILYKNCNGVWWVFLLILLQFPLKLIYCTLTLSKYF